MGTSAEWDRIYDVRRDAYGNTIVAVVLIESVIGIVKLLRK